MSDPARPLHEHQQPDDSPLVPLTPEEEPPVAVGGERRERLERRAGILPTRLGILLAGFLLATLPILLFGWLAVDVYQRDAIVLDAQANEALHTYSSPTLDTTMWLVTQLGATVVIAPLFVVVAALLVWKRRLREALFLSVALLGGRALNLLLKELFERPRPDVAWADIIPEYSFPSGHSMNSFIFYMALATIVWVLFGRGAGTVAYGVALVIAVAVGASRIYLGHHYLSDVIGGFLAGLIWLVTVATAIEGGSRAMRRRRTYTLRRATG